VSRPFDPKAASVKKERTGLKLNTIHTNVLYAKGVEDTSGEKLTASFVGEQFADASSLLKKARQEGYRVACFFIDPLMYTFEAGNEFYLNILALDSLENVNYYHSGAGPIHAIADAKAAIQGGLADIVAVFAYEPLYINKKTYGKDAVNQAMDDVFRGKSLIYLYNCLGEQMCKVLGISQDRFRELADALYDNHCRVYEKLHGEGSARRERGKSLAALGGGLFRMTDVANPNIDFAGGVILGSGKAASELRTLEKPVIVKAAEREMVRGGEDRVPELVGSQENIFPHLRRVFRRIETKAGISLPEEAGKANLLLNAYTCYPPIPLAFLLAGGFVKTAEEIPGFLREHDLTVNGGMSLARAAFNNPALTALIEICQKLQGSAEKYGIVHGNGGMGEQHGLALVERVEE